jgi:hypothetical protein
MIAWSFEGTPVGFQGMTFWACVLIGLFIPIEICNREGCIDPSWLAPPSRPKHTQATGQFLKNREFFNRIGRFLPVI